MLYLLENVHMSKFKGNKNKYDSNIVRLDF